MIASTGTALFNSKPPPDIVVAVHLTTLDSLCHPRAMTMAKLSFYACAIYIKAIYIKEESPRKNGEKVTAKNGV